ncbi:MAG: ATP-binding protein [Candidatus Cloacimonetes bacterium]|jgi:Cdc6-like AAA superfamily ATPase
MKSHILVPTQNVKKGLDCLSYVLNRPVANQVGLAMIYGKPGLGKTQFSIRYAIDHNCVYLSALKAYSPKSFTQELLRALLNLYEPDNAEPIIGSRAKLFREILDLINNNSNANSAPIIFIDEVDNIIHYPHEEIVGMIRDIADNTIATIILVGMQNLREKILKLNTHYYNRFIYFAEFKPLTNQDCLIMCKSLADINIADDLALFTNQKDQAAGDARKIIKSIRLYEEIAQKLNINSLDLKTYHKVIK